MKEQHVSLPVRYGTTAGSPEFEQVAKYFGVGKVEEETQGKSTEDGGIKGDFTGNVEQFKKSTCARRRFSNPGCLSEALGNLSSTSDEPDGTLRKVLIREGRESCDKGRLCTLGVRFGLNEEENNLKLLTRRAKAYSFHGTLTADIAMNCQKLNTFKDNKDITDVSSSKQSTISAVSRSPPSQITVISEDMPKRNRNIAKTGIPGDSAKVITNASCGRRESSEVQGRPRIDRRLSLPVHLTFSKPRQSGLPRRCSGPDKLTSGGSRFPSSDDDSAKKHSTRKLDGFTRPRKNSAPETAKFRETRISNTGTDSRKCERDRKVSLPTSLNPNKFDRFFTTERSLDSRKPAPGKGELQRFNDDWAEKLPANLGKQVNPEHIFRLWNVRLPKQLMEDLKTELQYKEREEEYEEKE